MQEELNNKTEFYDYAQIIYSERNILDEIIPWASALFLMYWGQLEGWDNENWYTSYYSTKLGSVASEPFDGGAMISVRSLIKGVVS